MGTWTDAEEAAARRLVELALAEDFDLLLLADRRLRRRGREGDQEQDDQDEEDGATPVHDFLRE